MSNIPLKTVNSDKPSSQKVKKVLVYGPGGVGKSASAATSLIGAPEGRRLVYLMTERNAVTGLEWGLKHHKLEVKEGQIIYVFPREKKKAFSDLDRALDLYGQQSKKEALKGDSDTSQGKENYGFLTKIVKTLASFTGIDYVTGEEVKIGNVGELTEKDILCVDGLSPIGSEIWNKMVGDKIAISMTDYGPPQRVMYSILAELAKLECHVILFAHAKDEMEEYEIGGGRTATRLKEIRVNTWVGQANYETLMGLFTDVIYAYKQGVLYRWAGNKQKVYTVSRTIPPKDNLEPNFSLYNFF